MNTGDMEKYCPEPHPVYFNAFSMWQQLSGSVQYLINTNILYSVSLASLSYIKLQYCDNFLLQILLQQKSVKFFIIRYTMIKVFQCHINHLPELFDKTNKKQPAFLRSYCTG